MDFEQVLMANEISKRVLKLNPQMAMALLGLLIDQIAAMNCMTGPELVDMMTPLVGEVYNQLGEFKLTETETEVIS